jgi:DNA-binding beta-propeller fold protein YncE
MLQLQHGFSSVEVEIEKKNNDNSNNPPGFKSIKKFDSNGKFITSWGIEGTDDGQYLHLHDVAIDSSDNVYVTDRDNCKVEKLTADGNFIRKWGSLGREDGEFWLPHDIAIDSSDNVYVIDSGNVHEKKEICAL